MKIHEWGTFTSLQDEDGRTLPGINTDDEPVPAFVHNLNPLLLLKPDQLPTVFFQGAPRCHPDVTMRMETPVIYFHLPPDTATPLLIDVEVKWHAGWLTQFYPDAHAEPAQPVGTLDSSTTGQLEWANLKIGGEAPGPATTNHAWISPRAVRADSLTTPSGETERFLFYRGVGHVNAPIRVVRTDNQLRLFSQLGAREIPRLRVRKLWLAEFRPDGACAFRVLPALEIGGRNERELNSISASFAPEQFAAGNETKLRATMRSALVQDGLFADEAEALLRTWELSYFKSAGLRLFFLVPRAWTDDCLPLRVSAPAEITRIMVGRIELVTPAHRRMLSEIAAGPIPTQPWAHFGVANGRAEIQGQMPAAYRDLGRFRNALLLDEEKRHPTPALTAFIRMNGLEEARR